MQYAIKVFAAPYHTLVSRYNVLFAQAVPHCSHQVYLVRALKPLWSIRVHGAIDQVLLGAGIRDDSE